jgi:hypothetical protein
LVGVVNVNQPLIAQSYKGLFMRWQDVVLQVNGCQMALHATRWLWRLENGHDPLFEQIKGRICCVCHWAKNEQTPRQQKQSRGKFQA